jgi:MFS family permease
MASVMAGGAVIGGIVAASRSNRRARSMSVAAVGWGLSILGAALARNIPQELVAMVFVGYGNITFNSISKTALQLASAPEMRGRVMALWAMAWSGSTVIGGPLVGWVAQDFGARWSLVVGALPTVLIGVMAFPSLRRIDHRSTALMGTLITTESNLDSGITEADF